MSEGLVAGLFFGRLDKPMEHLTHQNIPANNEGTKHEQGTIEITSSGIHAARAG
jgi:hypothetical protein